ncbi:hypothetical protein Q5Y75_24750 [Ruegeria sp. 2205SS24-7]|uniref:hypothetical protein n=1 Tax=Ruegeria discodermiae TaxID=3064389 RepID=UPI00274129E9|nr:hypothetical protein [Ruegeria sp. 2205SS24-7]MDP5220400.1 hypothetical protein [Ruegeria sp. 2205SS24-7]
MQSDWVSKVSEYLSLSLPRADDGWEDCASSAYQMGCEALAKLGHATMTDWGAKPIDPPNQPDPLPRWDDVCTAVLNLAQQRHEIDYRFPDGGVADFRTGTDRLIVEHDHIPPPANIAGGEGLGPAWCHEAVKSTLVALGLVTKDRWTRDAELVLWRQEPRAWALNVQSDPRFERAVQESVEAMPNDIRTTLDNFVKVDANAIADARSKWIESAEKTRDMVLSATGRVLPRPAQISDEELRTSLLWSRQYDIDWVFFRRWRLTDGWLSDADARRALEIFHDPLAMQMRRSVIRKLYPNAQIRNE